jgi:hypothetical protein
MLSSRQFIDFMKEGLQIIGEFISGIITEDECMHNINALRAKYGLKDSS